MAYTSIYRTNERQIIFLFIRIIRGVITVPDWLRSDNAISVTVGDSSYGIYVDNERNIENKMKSTVKNDDELKYTIYDFIRTIRDPEKPNTLEELNVVYEDGVYINEPTQGLCIRIKLERNIPYQIKLDIYIKEGAHATEHEINKQINDKERIAAAMENPNLKEMVENCIKEED
ncbi:hypothetical protein QE152_g27630 [Popillia japonica]|uniref:Uncharacterized protein n=1 Tax=Popillia japonica TaxID=7064 RepID=A0AAW1JRE7_POPJA